MSFPRYPAYKDSGVEWLGEVPAHWEVRRLRFVCDVQTGGRDTENAVERGDFPFFVRSQTVERIDSHSFDCEAVLTAGDGVGVGKVFHHHRSGPFDFHQRVYMMNNFRRVSGRFLFFYLREQFYKVALEGGAKSTVDSLRRPIFMNFPVAIPEQAEQMTIVDFLEEETSKIDCLIAEQERLIELLKEKRQAVISHAVTKGLNPDAAMKASGIDWLGDVPAHWSLTKVKHLTRSIEQGWSPQCEAIPADWTSEWGVLKVGCVNGGTFNPSENKLLSADLEPEPTLSLKADDLLVSRANTRELVGGAAVVDRDYPTLMLCDKLYRLRFDIDRCLPQFVAFYLGSTPARGQVELDATGASASMVNISQSAILDLMIAAPPLSEQEDIVRFIASQVELTERLIFEAAEATRILLERRATLISAAVTGQIDVRRIAERQTA